ncbi:hypothetical protein HELRODRAFT_182105 [Helobdella robusta]|uniref:Uncharacterized protein n=1 Tax=Helobdella robusta TaxID=6412 RepID=T1FHR6_HELRO|nr:hypothetical protein HELRODRAFT_182105 [Helobdella robusta]ESN91249.1 hypothetical protein HELRODRAFT_182105 [Helobdella robusta]
MMQIHSNDVLANARSESLSVDDEDKDDVFDVIIKLRKELLASDSDRFIQHRSSMNFENRWVLRSALNFASDGEVVREVGREFQRKRPEKAKADLAKECLTRVKKREEDDRKPGSLASAREQDMEIYEKRKGHEQLDEQQS